MGEPFSEQEMAEFLAFAGLCYESDGDEDEGEGEHSGPPSGGNADGGSADGDLGEESKSCLGEESSGQPGAAEAAAAAAIDGHRSPQKRSSRSGGKRKISITRQQFRRLPCWLGEESAELREAVTQNRNSVGDSAFGGEAVPLRGVQGGKTKAPLKLKAKGAQKSPKKLSVSTPTREERGVSQIQNVLDGFAGKWTDKPGVTELERQSIGAIFVQRHYRQNMKRQLLMGRMTPMPRHRVDQRRSRTSGSARNSNSEPGSPSRAFGWDAKSRNSTDSAAAAGISYPPKRGSRTIGGAPVPAPAPAERSRSLLKRGFSRSRSASAFALADDSPRSPQPTEPTTLSTSTRSPDFNLPIPRASPTMSSLPSPRAAARTREEDHAPSGLPRSSPEGVPTRAFARSRRAASPFDSDPLSRKPSQVVGGGMVPEPSREPTTTPEPADEEDAKYTI